MNDLSGKPVAPRKAKKRYKCHFEGCNKDFGKNYNLKAHLRMHTGEKPFKCTYLECGKDFMWRSSWISHLAAHRGLPDLQGVAEGNASQFDAMRADRDRNVSRQAKVEPEMAVNPGPVNFSSSSELPTQKYLDFLNNRSLRAMRDSAYSTTRQEENGTYSAPKTQNQMSSGPIDMSIWKKQVADAFSRVRDQEQREEQSKKMEPVEENMFRGQFDIQQLLQQAQNQQHIHQQHQEQRQQQQQQQQRQQQRQQQQQNQQQQQQNHQQQQIDWQRQGQQELARTQRPPTHPQQNRPEFDFVNSLNASPQQTNTDSGFVPQWNFDTSRSQKRDEGISASQKKESFTGFLPNGSADKMDGAEGQKSLKEIILAQMTAGNRDQQSTPDLADFIDAGDVLGIRTDNGELQNRIRSLELDLGEIGIEEDYSKHERRDSLSMRGGQNLSQAMVAAKKELRFADPVRRMGSVGKSTADRQGIMSPMMVSAVPSPFHPNGNFSGGVSSGFGGNSYGWPSQSGNVPSLSPAVMSPGGLCFSPTFLMSPGFLQSPSYGTTPKFSALGTFPTPIARDGNGEL